MTDDDWLWRFWLFVAGWMFFTLYMTYGLLRVLGILPGL